MTSAERAVYEAGPEEEYIFCNRWLSFLPFPPPNATTQKMILLALHVSEGMETSTEEVIEKEVGIVLNIEQIVCVRNQCSRKKDGRREVFVRIGKEENLSKQWLWRR